MVRLYQSNARSAFEADVVIVGVPDESKSHAKRKGASKGPDSLRQASNESGFFERNGKLIPVCPILGNISNKLIFDYGNIPKENLQKLITDLVANHKIPIVIGGDHSITSTVLQATGDIHGKLGLFYFDAHPDFVSSTTEYYGSVLTDSSRWIDFSQSMLIGTRAAEPEELENAETVGLEVITPIDVAKLGISRVANKLQAKGYNNKRYVSIDLDCADPAYAPGVSLPSSCGLSSIDLVYLVKLVVNSGVVGIDIVELSPDFDLNNMTANLAARILLESIASINISYDRI
ncbi:MAG TPA: arginase family protein [Nitrososphaeraceae archaeon]|nr:arginase family protein [Nitrososphaeraceae archaeon]